MKIIIHSFGFYALSTRLPGLLLIIILSSAATAQSWDFVKEKDGIKIYTRKEAGTSLKSYRGVADIKASAEKVFAMIEDVNHTEWWDKNFTQIKVLLYEKNKRAQYYLVYDLPWPVTDRDLCVDVKVSINSVTGERKITSTPLPKAVPECSDLIRIKNYRQSWTVTPAGNCTSHVVLEGLVDPAGNIPDWVSNMLMIDSPINVICGLRERLEKTSNASPTRRH